MSDPSRKKNEGFAENSPWNAPQYRIGDYAKYLGVTPDFLKHYEQFRIVSSEQKENGYRYYPFGQSYKILELGRYGAFNHIRGYVQRSYRRRNRGGYYRATRG